MRRRRRPSPARPGYAAIGIGMEFDTCGSAAAGKTIQPRRQRAPRRVTEGCARRAAEAGLWRSLRADGDTRGSPLPPIPPGDACSESRPATETANAWVARWRADEDRR